MDSRFTPVSLAQKDEYYALWDQTPKHSLDYTLANLWGWQQYYGLEWQHAHNLLWIRQTRPEMRWWAPIGDWSKADWAKLLPEIFGGRKHLVTRVPQELANIWTEALPGSVSLEEDRGQWEYLYLQQELATLAGNRFHKKRNHYNSYVKTYGEPDYTPVADTIIHDVLSLQNDWCITHECDESPSLRAENDAISHVLTHFQEFRNMVGGVLTIDGKMVAFSIGEALDQETLGVHFEKGLQGYKGIYQAMNLEFARHAGSGFKWINRAQDMDEEGLRQAKLTYMPADFLRKFKVLVTC